MTAGYSGKPLVRKLGIVAGQRVVAMQAPEHYEELLHPLPEGVEIVGEPEPETALAHLFVIGRADLVRQLHRLEPCLAKNGMLWISWPKKSSKVVTDLTEDRVREVGLAAGLVDVKVCAVDAIWSALKFVYRLKDR